MKPAQQQTEKNIGGDTNEDISKYDVIIIGAGAAGIAAATRLYEKQIRNFVIFEAENRIGGRIHSTQFENYTVDLGAQFCHGEDGNVVYEMVKDLNLLESEEDQSLYTVYHSTRRELDQELYEELFNVFEKLFYEEKEGVQGSFGEYMLKRAEEIFQKQFSNDEVMYTAAMEALDTYKLDLLANEGPFSWFDVAAEEDYEECDGSKLLGWKGFGFNTVLEVLMKILPQSKQQIRLSDKILLNTEVTKIHWNEDHVKVTCGKETFIAGQVIFTPSLGVLKQCHKTLFIPELPKQKVQAITTIGIGSVIKIIYYFPVKWWSEKDHNFTFVWSECDRKAVGCEFPEAVLSNGKSWLLEVLQLIRIANSPNLLGAWICGESVPEVELLADDKIVNGIMFLIKKFLGHLYEDICCPTKILRHSWYANNHFKGVYSYQTMKSRAIPGDSQEVVLGAPLCSNDGTPRLLFAGEATSPTHYGTVHGAIETGWREADRIVEFYKNKHKTDSTTDNTNKVTS